MVARISEKLFLMVTLSHEIKNPSFKSLDSYRHGEIIKASIPFFPITTNGCTPIPKPLFVLQILK